ncbi:MAG: peptidoglycan DD-metalloendopeptidase family protein [Xanthomonadales bacterium]|nr:peptidoglycan DD-metalloendopeptidase family protein [Gammaproteobacteria bacterium]NNL04505.1 peptidoglycan DD-metalloendopeptidase family protein [Xanthomonadales bacterium]
MLILLISLSAAGQESEPGQRAHTEARLQQVLQRIASEQEGLQSSRSQQRGEQARLKQVDLAIQDVNFRLADLARQESGHRQALKSLEQQRETYLTSLDDRLAQLAEQVRAAYRSSGHSRTRLLLNQDDPARISRMLAYYDYVNRARVQQITGLREALSGLEELQQPIDEELARIAMVQGEQESIRQELGVQRGQRNALLEKIARDIQGSESRLAELENNRRDLQDLLDRLADALADIPEDLERHAGVAGKKSRLPMPVTGPVRHAFGQKRTGGLAWQGWLIGAEAGTEVSAVAYGRVAFADWLRGYGLLMVIDHGEGFMTLYGHNESLLREAGEWVQEGDPISIVGSNPGSTQGAYFEIRREGRALDPAAWLAR